MRNEIAILIAAGKGERMRPLTLNTPKPLIKVNGTPMIETVISGLTRRGVKAIYVVVGYLGEQFTYLTEKYPNIKLLRNDEYINKNNISSIYTAKAVMGEADCFVCEADIYVSDLSIFDTEFDKSCYYGKMVEGHSEDWLFDLDGSGRIIRVGKSGDDKYNMCGVCYLKAKDSQLIRDAVVEAYTHLGDYEQKYWDEIVNQEISKISMFVNPVNANQIVELDSVAELKLVDSSYEGVIV